MELSIIDKNILLTLDEHGYTNQRSLSELSGYSIGSVNKSISILNEEGYIDSSSKLTTKGKNFIKSNSPKNAIILAAGYGMRMVPINTEMPKGLLTVGGDALIERLINQLREAGIEDITVVVGFMMESYDYLVDKFDVKMIYNNDYATKNNLHTLALAAKQINNTYIVPCDVWSRENVFSKKEAYSWYMVSDEKDEDSWIRINRKSELVRVSEDARDKAGNKMIGIAYICGEESERLREKLIQMDADLAFKDSFWEEASFAKDRMFLDARVAPAADVTEINTYEQLREIDSNSMSLASDAIETAANALKVSPEEIVDIEIMKKGMTNRSFIFKVGNDKYVMRIPGEGTDQLINRKEEADVYSAIHGKGICDDNIYLNPENGYKITRFIDGGRNCDPENVDDLRRCMKKLRSFHDMKLKVGHDFDIFKMIDYYESLWATPKSVFRDYADTKAKILSLKDYIDSQKIEKVLTHIDAVQDNFMMVGDDIYLIDWEYAGMQDRYVDLAMFSIYAYYEKAEIDRLIDLYFEAAGEKTDEDIRTRVYAYVAMCGLLWSSWTEYKKGLGIDFGDYGIRQYRYAKDFYKYFCERTEGK